MKNNMIRNVCKTFDVKQDAALPIGIKEQAAFKEKISSERMRHERILVDCGDKKLELQFKSVVWYLLAYMIRNDPCLSVFPTSEDVKSFCIVAYMGTTSSKISLLLIEALV